MDKYNSYDDEEYELTAEQKRNLKKCRSCVAFDECKQKINQYLLQPCFSYRDKDNQHGHGSKRPVYNNKSNNNQKSRRRHHYYDN